MRAFYGHCQGWLYQWQNLGWRNSPVRFWELAATGEAESDIMKSRQTETPSAGTQGKQLQGIALETVLEKRRLGQAMNAKEFAVCVGVSYSTASFSGRILSSGAPGRTGLKIHPVRHVTKRRLLPLQNCLPVLRKFFSKLNGLLLSKQGCMWYMGKG
jgi:hypothetical protein